MAEKIEIEFELKFKKALGDIGKLEKELKDVQKTVKDSNEATEKQIKDVEKAADGSAKGVKKVGLSIKNIASAVGVVALLQKGFEFVSSAIQENQQVMDGLNIVFETAQIVFNQVLNAFIGIYESVSSASENFDALGKVITNLVTLALTPLKLAFFAIKLGMQEVSLAYEKVFGSDASVRQARKDLRETQQALKDVANEAVEAGKEVASNIVEAVTEVAGIGNVIVEEFGKVSIKVAAETAKSNIELKKSAAIAAAESRMALERYATESEQLRQLRDDDRNSIEDRIKANNDLKEVLKNQQAEMLANVAMVEKAAQAQFDLTGKDEDYIAVLDAKAERLGVISAIEGFNSEQKSNDTALTKEQIDLTKAQLESESILSIERQRFNAELIEDELVKLKKLQEIDEIEKEQETLRLQNIVDTAGEGTQAKIDAQIALDQFLETSRQTNLTRAQEIALAETELEEKKKAEKIATLDTIISIAGAESKLGKVAFIAKMALQLKEQIADARALILKAKTAMIEAKLKGAGAGVEVSGSIAKGANTAPPPFNIPFILAAVATGIGIISTVKAAVNATKAAASASGGGGAGGGGNIPTPSVPAVAAPEPPAFNIVGSSETNQLAGAIGGQSQQPVQAFVVASEVTSAQSLERNTIAGATIG